MARRRIVIHGGLPKTGTTAIQELLHEKRDELEASGTWFPKRFPSPTEHLHRFFVEELRGDPSLRRTAAIISEAAERGVRQVLLSIEGVSAHADAIREDAAATFVRLTREWDAEIVVVLRDPAKWLLSMYRQCVINPSISRDASNLEQRYSTDMPFAEFSTLEEVRAICSRERLEEQLLARFPTARLSFLRYEDDFVGGFAALCDIEEMISAGRASRVNTMVPDSHLDILRRVNGYASPQVVHQLLRAIVSTLNDDSNVHLALCRAQLPAGLGTRAAGFLLHHLLGRLRFRPNPPLDTDAESFRTAVSDLRREAMRRALGRSAGT